MVIFSLSRCFFLDKYIKNACILLLCHLQKEDTKIPGGLEITASPDKQVNRSQTIELNVIGAESLKSDGLIFEWQCSKLNNHSLATNGHQLF